MTERGLHEVQAAAAGVPARGEAAFAGASYRLRPAALPPLLRYVAALAPPPPAGEDDGFGVAATAEQVAAADSRQASAVMAAAHRLLEDTLDPAVWPGFCQAALDAKTGHEQVHAVIRQVITEHTAWPYWPAVRLLSWLAGDLPGRDGAAIAAGRGLAGMSPREACNWAYHILLGMTDDDDARETFISDLMFDGNPDAEALTMVRAMQRARHEREAAGG